jgi:hypothetical protein
MRKFLLVLCIASAGIPALCQSEECITAPTTYAETESWYLDNEVIQVKGNRYVKYGLPRVLAPGEVELAGNYRNTDVYAEAGTKGIPSILYIPVRKGCEFQPYLMELPECNVSVKLAAAPKTTSTGKVYVFSATATSKYKKLTYTWFAWLTDAAGERIEEIDTYDLIIGNRTGKTLVMSAKGLKKGWTINVRAKVTADGVDCTAKEEVLSVKVK